MKTTTAQILAIFCWTIIVPLLSEPTLDADAADAATQSGAHTSYENITTLREARLVNVPPVVQLLDGVASRPRMEGVKHRQRIGQQGATGLIRQTARLVIKRRIDRTIPEDAPGISGKTRQETIDALATAALSAAPVTNSRLLKAIGRPERERQLAEEVKQDLKHTHPEWPWEVWERYWDCLFKGCKHVGAHGTSPTTTAGSVL